MSLDFGSGGSTPNLDLNEPASLGSLPAVSVLCWIYPTALANNRVIYSTVVVQGAGPLSQQIRLSDTSGNLRWAKNRADPDTDMVRTTNDAPLSANAWHFVACTGDTASASNFHIYTGTLSALAVERAYGTSIDGTGTTTETDTDPWIGNMNDGSGTRSFAGRIGLVAVFNRVLSLGEIQSFQFMPRVLPGCLLLMPLGFNGTGAQHDLSGGGISGTVVSATRADDVPLRWLRRSSGLYVPVAAAAGGSGVPRIMHHLRQQRAA